MTNPNDDIFNDTLKRLTDGDPKPQEEVKDEAKAKRESERRRKLGPIDPIKRSFFPCRLPLMMQTATAWLY